MIVSARRRLYSNVITEDNGDIGVNSEVYLNIENSYTLSDGTNIRDVFSSYGIQNIKQQFPGSYDYDETTEEYCDQTFKIRFARLSDKVAKRFNYDANKLNSFLNDYTVSFGIDFVYNSKVDNNPSIYFTRSGNNIYLMIEGKYFSGFYGSTNIALKGDTFAKRTFNNNIIVNDDYIPSPYIYISYASLKFNNLHITENDFVSFYSGDGLTYSIKTYRLPETIIVPSQIVEWGSTGDEDELLVTYITKTLNPYVDSSKNYEIILISFDIETTVNVGLEITADNNLYINSDNYTHLNGGCSISNVLYNVISW